MSCGCDKGEGQQIRTPETYERFIRAFNIQGQHELPGKVARETQVGITLADLRDPEYIWLGRQSRWQQGAVVAGVAAQFPAVQLVNPAGSGTIAVVWWSVSNNVGALSPGGWAVGSGGQLAGTAAMGQAQPLDSRQGVTTNPILQAFAGNLAATVWVNMYQSGNGTFVSPSFAPSANHQIVLLPGFFVVVGWSTAGAAAGLGGTFTWSERPFSQQEEK